MGGWTKTFGNSHETEVIDVSSSSSSSPFGDIDSKRPNAVGGLLGSTPILCGAEYGDFEDTCISFKNSQWAKTHVMTTKRGRAASVQLNSTTMWILGGRVDNDNYIAGHLRSTEFIRTDSSVGIPGPTLPIAMFQSCAVKYSDHQIYIIGGLRGRETLNKVYIYNPMDGFNHIEGPALNNKREDHACAVMSNGQQSNIVVAGGYRNGNGVLSSVEILDPTVNNWIPGKEIQFYFKKWNSNET